MIKKVINPVLAFLLFLLFVGPPAAAAPISCQGWLNQDPNHIAICEYQSSGVQNVSCVVGGVVQGDCPAGAGLTRCMCGGPYGLCGYDPSCPAPPAPTATPTPPPGATNTPTPPPSGCALGASCPPPTGCCTPDGVIYYQCSGSSLVSASREACLAAATAAAIPTAPPLVPGGGTLNPAAKLLIQRIYNFMLPIGTIIGAFFIVLSGYKIKTSEGDPQKMTEGKEEFTAAVVGTSFVILSMVILRMILSSLF